MLHAIAHRVARGQQRLDIQPQIYPVYGTITGG